MATGRYSSSDPYLLLPGFRADSRRERLFRVKGCRTTRGSNSTEVAKLLKRRESVQTRYAQDLYLTL